MNLRLITLEFGAIERIEIVLPEECLGHFRKELLRIGQAVMLHFPAVDVQNALVFAAVTKASERGGDLGVIEAENLVMVRMGQFVQHRPGLHALMADARPLRRIRNVYAPRQSRIKSVRLEPVEGPRAFDQPSPLGIRLVNPVLPAPAA